MIHSPGLHTPAPEASLHLQGSVLVVVDDSVALECVQRPVVEYLQAQVRGKSRRKQASSFIH